MGTIVKKMHTLALKWNEKLKQYEQMNTAEHFKDLQNDLMLISRHPYEIKEPIKNTAPMPLCKNCAAELELIDGKCSYCGTRYEKSTKLLKEYENCKDQFITEMPFAYNFIYPIRL